MAYQYCRDCTAPMDYPSLAEAQAGYRACRHCGDETTPSSATLAEVIDRMMDDFREELADKALKILELQDRIAVLEKRV